MGYEIALSKAWEELVAVTGEKSYRVFFLADTYDIGMDDKTVFSVSCNIPAGVPTTILLLHYLRKRLDGLPPIKEEWIQFKELAGGEGYYPTFKKRVIDTLVRKYKDNPEGLFGLVERFRAKKVQLADVSVVLDTFDESAPILITFWRADEEFGAEMNLLFDRSISDIFCTEDVVVLSELVAHRI